MNKDKKIIITNNGTIITPYTPRQCRVLEAATSIYDNVYHKRIELTGFKVKYNGIPSFITHKNSPTYIQNLFPDYMIEYEPEIRPYLIDYSFSLKDDIIPTDIESGIISEIMGYINGRSNTREWFINLQTGYGKTLLSVCLASMIQYKTLILCFSTEILKQWIKTFREMTTIDMSRVLLIDSSKILDAVYNGNFDCSKYDIFLCTLKMVTGYGSKKDYGYLSTVFSNMGIGLKIIDEAHRNMSNIVRINATTNVRYTLYLSADFGQGDYNKEEKYYRIFHGVPIIKPPDEYGITMKHTAAIVIDFNSKPTEAESNSIFNKYGFSSQLYMEYEYRKEKIFRVLKYVIDHIIKVNDKYKILILLTHIEHVDIMWNYLQDLYSDKLRIGRYHSMVPDLEKDITLNDCNVIVSTYSSFGTGIDNSNIKYVISMNQANKIEDNQAAGRARPMADGSDVFYFMLVDKGFQYCTRKLKTRLEYLTKTKLKKIIRVKYYE